MMETVLSARLLTTTVDPSGETRARPGAAADAQRRRHRAMIQVEHRNIVRARVGDVGAVPVGRNVDEVRTAIHADGGDDFILLRVDHADVRRAGIDDVNLILLRIGRNSGGLEPNRQRPHHRKSLERIGRRSMTETVLLLPFVI